jgi:hypothetical protein
MSEHQETKRERNTVLGGVWRRTIQAAIWIVELNHIASLCQLKNDGRILNPSIWICSNNIWTKRNEVLYYWDSTWTWIKNRKSVGTDTEGTALPTHYVSNYSWKNRVEWLARDYDTGCTIWRLHAWVNCRVSCPFNKTPLTCLKSRVIIKKGSPKVTKRAVKKRR